MLKHIAPAMFAAALLSACGQTATTTATTPPLPACEAQTFIVYFPYDVSEMTPEGAQVVDAAVEKLKACAPDSLKVSAHSDGSEAAADAGISQARGTAVQTYLTAHGVTAPITVEDLKFDHPSVPTAPGVKEPLNRNVEIVVNGGI